MKKWDFLTNKEGVKLIKLWYVPKALNTPPPFLFISNKTNQKEKLVKLRKIAQRGTQE